MEKLLFYSMRFKFKHLKFKSNKSPKMVAIYLNDYTEIQKPNEIPDEAIREGKYMISLGKGISKEIVYLQSVDKWLFVNDIDTTNIYQMYEWYDIPNLSKKEEYLFINTPSKYLNKKYKFIQNMYKWNKEMIFYQKENYLRRFKIIKK